MMNFSCRRRGFTFSVIRRSDDLNFPPKNVSRCHETFQSIHCLTNFFIIIFQDLEKDASFRKQREALAVLRPKPGTRSNCAGSVKFGLIEIDIFSTQEFNKEIVNTNLSQSFLYFYCLGF